MKAIKDNMESYHMKIKENNHIFFVIYIIFFILLIIKLTSIHGKDDDTPIHYINTTNEWDSLKIKVVDLQSKIIVDSTTIKIGGDFIPIVNTNLTVKINQFIPDFKMDSNDNLIYSKSKDLNNPAMKITILQKDKKETKVLWIHSNYPDIRSINDKYSIRLVGFIRKSQDINQTHSSMKSLEELNIKAIDENGFTPLHKAAETGNIEQIELLISKGANINAKTNNGITPLYIVAKYGYKNVVELLINNNATINSENNFSPLLIAFENGHNEIAEFLIDKGVDVNVKHRSGWTPLDLAIDKKDKKLIKLLISKGANTKSINGLQLLDLAADKDLV
ncbi:MAG: ankyrin repeat domain-containing protein [Candidatus Firestonebacteria bacterium]|nr:ankyrin repeat domain-containing protein [Candidatus Firestonebacteria bacterium]